MASSRTTDYENITPKQAIQIQQQLRDRIKLEPMDREVETVGGADLSFNRGSNKVHASIVVFSLPELELVARSLISTEVDFPYIPGLLAFRELPALTEAWEQCTLKPGVLILDGHGIAHPRRMGIATHFGILADHPTIGCAKNALTGTYEEPAPEKGSFSYLKEEREKIGMVLRSRTDVNPVFISPGHKLSFDDAYSIMMKALTKYKLPKTTRLAHQWANKLRKGEAEPGYFTG